MSNIIKLSEKRQAKDHTAGEAFCINCSYEWAAVSKIGRTQLQCPNCNSMKGLYKFPFHVSEDEEYRQCNCGNHLFILTKKGHLCPNCGDYQDYD